MQIQSTHNHLKIWPFWSDWSLPQLLMERYVNLTPQGSSKCLESILKVLPFQWPPHKKKKVMHIRFFMNCCQRFNYTSAGRYHKNTNFFFSSVYQVIKVSVMYLIKGRTRAPKSSLRHKLSNKWKKKSCFQRRVSSFRNHAYFGPSNIEA